MSKTEKIKTAAIRRGRVLVVGDVMLDRYWFGDVSRISPEAPVPIVKVDRIEDRPGGAANVARNAAALGTKTSLLFGGLVVMSRVAACSSCCAGKKWRPACTPTHHFDDGEAACDRPPAAAAAR